MVENTEKNLRKAGFKPLKVEGKDNSRWILLDYNDVIIHIFDDETRAYYELEKFWIDAPRISFNGEKSL